MGEELVCPNCKSDDYTEITGWCANYCEPLIMGECVSGPDRPMCCDVIYNMEGVYYCENCHHIFDEDGNRHMHVEKSYGEPMCPYGVVIPFEDEFDEELIITAWERHQKWSVELINNGLYEISLIMNVSAIETYLRSKFYANRQIWFSHIDCDIERRSQIVNVVRNLGIRDRFFDRMFIGYGKKVENVDYNYSLFNILVPMKKINFQALNGSGSYPWAYKCFLDIDIKTLGQQLKIKDMGNKSLWYWIEDMYQKRHMLVHGSELEEIYENKARFYQRITQELMELVDEEINNLYMNDEINLD